MALQLFSAYAVSNGDSIETILLENQTATFLVCDRPEDEMEMENNLRCEYVSLDLLDLPTRDKHNKSKDENNNLLTPSSLQETQYGYSATECRTSSINSHSSHSIHQHSRTRAVLSASREVALKWLEMGAEGSLIEPSRTDTSSLGTSSRPKSDNFQTPPRSRDLILISPRNKIVSEAENRHSHAIFPNTFSPKSQSRIQVCARRGIRSKNRQGHCLGLGLTNRFSPTAATHRFLLPSPFS